ncbi:MAG: tRNA 2-thiouridine(34) synthase MnmA [Vampirovibrionales bacterium]
MPLHHRDRYQNWLPDKPSRIVVGMSGGVDSSAIAYMLKEQGHEVVGLTAWTLNGPGTCCNDALVNAGRVCEELGCDFDTVDLRAEFFHYVMDYYNKSYEAGLTPNPCVECNRYVKWEKLVDYARTELGADYVATGHYINSVRPTGATGPVHIQRAVDPFKDQTYMLARVYPNDLKHALFPLGLWHKKEVVAYALEKGIPTAKAKESMDVCFVLNGQSNYLKQTLGQHVGDIVDLDTGKIVGQHEGHYLFTRGQRRGVNVAAGRPVYVIKTEASTNTVYIGDKSHLESWQFTVTDVNWLNAPQDEVQLKVRYAGEPSHAKLERIEGTQNDYTVQLLDAPVTAVTPGQVAVFYDMDNLELLGGGAIETRIVHAPFNAATAPPLPDLNCELV